MVGVNLGDEFPLAPYRIIGSRGPPVDLSHVAHARENAFPDRVGILLIIPEDQYDAWQGRD
jgi:hypothetical protein